jgi:hypothetical protein
VEARGGVLDRVAAPRPVARVLAQGHGDFRHHPWHTHWTVRQEGAVLSVKAHGTYQSRPSGGGYRGVIGDFTYAARRRCLQTMASYDWSECRRLLMVTLTYPASSRPSTAESKAALRRFRTRWERATGAGARGAWKREYTRQGIPHFHLWLDAPRWWSLAHARAVVASQWFAAAATGIDAHLRAGTSCEEAMAHPARYAAGYATAGGRRKDYQHKRPADAPAPGRWWGVWNITRVHDEAAIPEWNAKQLRRYMHRLRVARTRSYRASVGLPAPARARGGRFRSAWLLLDFHDPDPVATRLLCAAGVLDPEPRRRQLP